MSRWTHTTEPGRFRRPTACVAALLLALALGACDVGSRDPAGPGETPRADASTPGDGPSSPPSISPASPSPGPERLAFAVIGDFGTATLDQLSVAARMCQWRESHPYDLVITTGDNIYPDGSPELFDAAFFKPYKCLLDEGVRWHASLGNHDWATEEGRPELEEPAFGMNGTHYVVRRSGVRFVIANSNAIDRTWLRENLPAQEGDRWTVVAFHHPVYSPGLHGSSETLADLPKLFERTGVDLVLNGHDHLYSVTEPLGGIRYVVTGGGGAELYPCLLSEQSEICELEHHFLYVVADDKRISVQAVPDDGDPFHRFSTRGID